MSSYRNENHSAGHQLFDGSQSFRGNQSFGGNHSAGNDKSLLSPSDIYWQNVYTGVAPESGLGWVQITSLAISALAVVVCGAVVYAQLREWRTLRDVSNLVVFFAVVADMMNGLTYLAFACIVAYLVKNTKYNEVLCLLGWVPVAGFATYGWSSWSRFLIAYQRYDTVTRPIRQWLTVRKTWAAAVAIWIGSVVVFVAILPLTGVAKRPSLFRLPDNYTAHCLPYYDNNDEAIGIAFCQLAVLSFAPLILSGFFFSRLLAVAWKVNNEEVQEGRTSPEESEAAQTGRFILIKCRGFWCVVAIVMTDVLLVTPFHIALLTKVSTGYPKVIVTRVMSVLSLANFVAHSIVYAIWSKSLRLQLRRAFCCWTGVLRERPG